MELKEAMEAATADLDVRPGFVGDVMAGARRRHTRKLLAVTAAVALLAGLVTGIVLTSDKAGYTTDDPRLTAATGGDLAGDSQLATRALTTWRNAQDEAWRQKAAVTEVSARPKVFWAGMTPSGPVALVAQAVRVRNSPDPQTLVGLVHDDAVVGFDVAYEDEPLSESGIYRFGPDDSTYVVLTLGQRIFWSADPVRGPDLRYSRTWWQAETRDGVAVMAVADSRHPVFVRSDTAPAADDFTRRQLMTNTDTGRQKAIEPWPGLGWKSTMWASRRQEPSMPGPDPNRSVFEDLRKRGYVDYDLLYTPWQVHAWLPDGRFATVLEMQGELFCALYLADGTFERVLTGGPAVKGAPIPVRIALPDGQGTILAERGVLLGPDEQEDAWIAPPGTTEVTVWHSGSSTVVPL